ncbi:phosphatidate cytidylyltransferase [Streptococcus sp. FDAARGOS_256]|uniref:phosphatidate cytidylyltransferase n=1 Tax=Streptococcus sp. FDAARGOS_256 TaxID=1975706 RepID=UPI000BADF709|nr:phosphatidate cytidylyltransferase [Streptococcus sp. FDAARGOS_256]PNK71988.1 phosphatidate cytidylyltransferase [Streptococcus sp. FDAARGOS_256]
MTKDLQKRTLFAVLALAIFLPVLFAGGLLLQIGIGLLAMLGVHELLHMKGLKTMTIEGAMTLFATFALTIPLENYLTFLPVDGNVVAYSVLIMIMLGTTVFSKSYTIEDAAFPIAVSFYVGFGFNALLDARVAGFDKVLLALFIVWATDSAAYLTGMNFGKHKLAPRVSPNKSIEGFVGGILGAVLITVIFMLVDSTVALPYGIYRMSLFAAFFSVAGQFGDLIESAMKRHFGVKDSGKFIPGHGGVLDRFDSMLIVFPMMHLFGLF